MAWEDTLTQASGDSVIVLTARRPLQGKWYTGTITSDKIGPARHWGNVRSAFNPVENAGADDRIWLSVIGVDKNGNDTLLLNRITNFTPSLSFIDAGRFPYVKLKMEFEDSTNRTPNQFGRWLVNYDPTAEGCINPSLGYTFHSSKIQQGRQSQN